jgi:hypothetical protein
MSENGARAGAAAGTAAGGAAVWGIAKGVKALWLSIIAFAHPGHIDPPAFNQGHIDPPAFNQGHIDPPVFDPGHIDPPAFNQVHIDPPVFDPGHIDPPVFKHPKMITEIISRDQLNSGDQSQLQNPAAASVSYFAVIPSNDNDFDGVFGHPPARDEKKQTVAALRSFKNIVKSDNLKLVSANDNHEVFSSFLASQNSEYIAIIGHNEGGDFRLPNREKIAISEMAQECYHAAKKCIFLSCTSNQWITSGQGNIGLDRMLTFPDAVALVASVKQRISSSSPQTLSYLQFVDVLQTNLNTQLQQRQVRIHVQYMVVRTGKIALVVGAIITIEQNLPSLGPTVSDKLPPKLPMRLSGNRNLLGARISGSGLEPP